MSKDKNSMGTESNPVVTRSSADLARYKLLTNAIFASASKNSNATETDAAQFEAFNLASLFKKIKRR